MKDGNNAVSIPMTMNANVNVHNEDTNSKQIHGKKREALPQILAVSIKNVLLFGYGMTLGFPTILIPTLQESSSNRESLILTSEQISWISSINLITVPLGCLFSGIITQWFGRKRSMQLVNIPFIIAWLLFYWSNRVEHLYAALSLTGLGGGLLEAPVLTYVAEITQPYLRGMLSATSSMTIIFGVFVQFLFGSFLPWRTIALMNVAIPVLAILLLFFVPESPHWLILKGRPKEAQQSLAWLRGWTHIDRVKIELQQLQQSIEQQQQERHSQKTIVVTLAPFGRRTFLKPFGLVACSFFFGHFSGMTTLQTFAVQIFDTFHAPIDKYYATLLLGVVELVGSLICVLLVHTVGKRPLTLLSTTGCALCFLIVATYAFTSNITHLRVPSASNSSVVTSNEYYYWLPTAFLITSALLSHLSIRLLPWILIGEVFPSDIRSVASGLAGGVGYVFGFLANRLFLAMVAALTLYGTFYFYATVSFLATVYMFFMLPETEGRPLNDIQMHFNGTQKILRNAGVHKNKHEPNDPIATPRISNYKENGHAKIDNIVLVGYINHGFAEKQ